MIESTQSALQVTNNVNVTVAVSTVVTNVVSVLKTPEGATIATGFTLIGLIGTIVLKIGSKIISLIFGEWEKKKKKRRDLAKKITVIVVEARTGGYKKQPRNVEHLVGLGIDLKRFDPETGKLFSIFCAFWEECATINNPSSAYSSAPRERLQETENFQRDLGDKADQLLIIADRWENSFW